MIDLVVVGVVVADDLSCFPLSHPLDPLGLDPSGPMIPRSLSELGQSC